MIELEREMGKIEQRLGGLIKVPRTKVSPFDPRSKEVLSKGQMSGGNKVRHGYGKVYAKELAGLVGKSFTFVELGVLAGNSIAMWSELFPKARVIGLDIDLTPFYRKEEDFKKKGFYSHGNYEVYEFDQMLPVEEQQDLLKGILKGDKMDVAIHDCLHMDEPILRSTKAFLPFMAENSLYFVEDRGAVYDRLKTLLGPAWNVEYHKTGQYDSDHLIVGKNYG